MFDPADLLHFIEMDGFGNDWEDLGLTDDDLCALQLLIMAGGKNAPVMPRTGGMRKLRFAPADWRIGKRGAARVCFAYFEKYGTVILIAAYSKNERDDLSEKAKALCKLLIEEAGKELDRIWGNA